jgi:hypothetical protein
LVCVDVANTALVPAAMRTCARRERAFTGLTVNKSPKTGQALKSVQTLKQATPQNI